MTQQGLKEPSQLNLPHMHSSFTCRLCGAMFFKENELFHHIEMRCLKNFVAQPSISYSIRELSMSKQSEMKLKLPSSVRKQVYKPKLSGRFNFSLKNLKFHSGKIHENEVTSLYFSGSIQLGSLIGGCGWWIVQKDLVCAYGAAPVLQTFPSLVRLEYEALLNGLQSAIRKRIRRLSIKGSSDLILTQLYSGFESLVMFQTVNYAVKDIHSAILRALKQFDFFEFELIDPAKSFYSKKLAEKAVIDYQYNFEQNIAKKVKESVVEIDGIEEISSSNDSLKQFVLKTIKDCQFSSLLSNSV